MSDDTYADDNLEVVQDNEIEPSDLLLHAPDAHAFGAPLLTYHQGADYGDADTAVTVAAGTQCVHDGVAYGSGETVEVPAAVARYWVSSAWATAESDPVADEPDESTPDGSPEPKASPASRPTKAPTRATAAAGSSRRKPLNARRVGPSESR